MNFLQIKRKILGVIVIEFFTFPKFSSAVTKFSVIG